MVDGYLHILEMWSHTVEAKTWNKEVNAIIKTRQFSFSELC